MTNCSCSREAGIYPSGIPVYEANNRIGSQSNFLAVFDASAVNMVNAQKFKSFSAQQHSVPIGFDDL